MERAVVENNAYKALGAILALLLIFSLPGEEKREIREIRSSEAHSGRKTHISQKDSLGYTLEMEITHYTAFCPEGCIGITKTGIDVRNSITYKGMGIIAVDPSVIPLGTVVQIDGKLFSAQDTGGAIKGRKIDILVESEEMAYRLGRFKTRVFIVKDGLFKP